MKNLIWKCVNTVRKKAALLLLTVLATQSLYALDYPEAGDFAKGSKAWSENCARCHNMRNPTDLKDGLTSLFHMRVRAGLTGQETRDIVTFLKGVNTRSRNGSVSNAEVKASVNESQDKLLGKGIYENNCMACHSADGRGGLPSVPDFTRKNGRLTKKDSELLSNIINGYQSSGSLMAMPPRGGNSQLSDADLNAALKYIKASFSE
ncbi:c-type cytochrome [Pseudomaricurvus alkylphenolicus]|nr:c-type cytochrome [Pseudomaricurvus alkylphenolicus]